MSDTCNVLRSTQANKRNIAYGDGVASPTNPRGAAFAALIREARRRHGWTQDMLVERSGVSRSTLLRWEAGDISRPDQDQVRAICETLGIPIRQAAVALGYLDAEDLNPPGKPRTLTPDLEEVLDILQDPRVPSVAKDALMGYLRQLRAQAGGGSQNRARNRAG